MADYTLSSRSVITPFRCAHGSPRIIGSLDASTTANAAGLIKVGQIVQMDGGTSSAAHRLVQASTGGLPNLSTSIAGVAAQSDTSDGSTTGLADGKRQISIWAAFPGTEFKFPTNLVTASTLVGTGLAIKWDSTLGIHHLAANSTAGDLRVIVTEVLNAGDTNGYVVGRFYSSAVTPMFRTL